MQTIPMQNEESYLATDIDLNILPPEHAHNGRIIAASPMIKIDAPSAPYRVVIWRKGDGELVVINQGFQNGNLEQSHFWGGHYVQDDLPQAMYLFTQRLMEMAGYVRV